MNRNWFTVLGQYSDFSLATLNYLYNNTSRIISSFVSNSSVHYNVLEFYKDDMLLLEFNYNSRTKQLHVIYVHNKVYLNSKEYSKVNWLNVLIEYSNLDLNKLEQIILLYNNSYWEQNDKDLLHVYLYDKSATILARYTFHNDNIVSIEEVI